MLLGAEIIDEKEDEIVIQISIGHPDLSIERADRRMTILALAPNREAILTLKKIMEISSGIFLTHTMMSTD